METYVCAFVSGVAVLQTYFRPLFEIFEKLWSDMVKRLPDQQFWVGEWMWNVCLRVFASCSYRFVTWSSFPSRARIRTQHTLVSIIVCTSFSRPLGHDPKSKGCSVIAAACFCESCWLTHERLSGWLGIDRGYMKWIYPLRYLTWVKLVWIMNLQQAIYQTVEIVSTFIIHIRW